MSVSADELSRFVAATPPRTIPPGVRAAKLPSGPLVIAAAVALFVLLGSIPMVAAVFPHRLLDDLRLDLGSPARAKAVVAAVADTGHTMVVRDGDRDVELPIQRISFRFRPADGPAVEAASHSPRTPPPEVDSEVDVEYLLGSPSIARIVGTTISATPRVGAWILVMPAIALAWLWRVRWQRRRVHELLVHGRFQLAGVESLTEHAVTFGPPRVSATLRTPDGDELEVDYDGNRREAAALRRIAATGSHAGVLRDPHRPERLMLTDTLLSSAPTIPAGDEEDDDEEWDP